jgi:hypothetical protein
VREEEGGASCHAMLAPETAVKTIYRLGEDLTVRELLAGRDRGRRLVAEAIQGLRRGYDAHGSPPTRSRAPVLRAPDSRTRSDARLRAPWGAVPSEGTLSQRFGPDLPSPLVVNRPGPLAERPAGQPARGEKDRVTIPRNTRIIVSCELDATPSRKHSPRPPEVRLPSELIRRWIAHDYGSRTAGFAHSHISKRNWSSRARHNAAPEPIISSHGEDLQAR